MTMTNTQSVIALALHAKLEELFAERTAMTAVYTERLADLDREYLALADRFRSMGYPRAADHVDAEHWTTRAAVTQSLARSTHLYDTVIARVYDVLGVQTA